MKPLLYPISKSKPCGEWIRYEPEFQGLSFDREEENPNLPMGEWERPLKKVDWAKIKARLLQGDTGTGSGVRVKKANKTIIDTIEVFKTRRKKIDSYENFSVYLSTQNAQINNIRIRADCGANGLLINSLFNQINSINIDCKYPNPGFKNLRISRPQFQFS